MRWLIDWLLRRRAQRLIRFILPDLPPVGPILDVGSGTGHNAECLMGISRLEVAQADVVDMHWVGSAPVLFDGNQLPFLDAEFSVSMLLFVLQYAADPERLLGEMRRVTAGKVMVLQSTCSGVIGSVILRVWEFTSGRFPFFVAGALGLVPVRTCALRPRRFFTRPSLERLIRTSGFRLRAVRRLDALSLLVSRDLYVLERPAPCP